MENINFREKDFVDYAIMNTCMDTGGKVSKQLLTFYYAKNTCTSDT